MKEALKYGIIGFTLMFTLSTVCILFSERGFISDEFYIYPIACLVAFLSAVGCSYTEKVKSPLKKAFLEAICTFPSIILSTVLLLINFSSKGVPPESLVQLYANAGEHILAFTVGGITILLCLIIRILTTTDVNE